MQLKMKRRKAKGSTNTRKRKSRQLSDTHRERIQNTLLKQGQNKKDETEKKKKENKSRNITHFLASLNGHLEHKDKSDRSNKDNE